ncbi:hypothetical protein JX266_002826 [Neoarthrinium moseri]|nr:hypothetical protein JX266_002826 [Neoarthrinium moseri]
MMSVGSTSPGEDGADDTSDALDMLDSDLPGMPGRRAAMDDKYDDGFNVRPKLAISPGLAPWNGKTEAARCLPRAARYDPGYEICWRLEEKDRALVEENTPQDGLCPLFGDD